MDNNGEESPGNLDRSSKENYHNSSEKKCIGGIGIIIRIMKKLGSKSKNDNSILM